MIHPLDVAEGVNLDVACAKPPDAASMTPPETPRHPGEVAPSELLRELTLFAKYARPGTDLNGTLARGELIIEQAKRDGASSGEIARLEQQLESLRGEARRSARAALQVSFDLLGGRTTAASKANIAMVHSAMSDDNHWAAKEMRAGLMKLIERSGHIPASYKPQLHRDLAIVLRMCPHAGGLVQELTLRGQRGATGSSSKIGSKSNAAVGAAYELMGAAALATKVSKPTNPGAPALFIRSGEDIVTFGDKTYLNGSPGEAGKWKSPARSTIECDLRIGRSTLDGYREIGVDFKHRAEMGTTYSSKNLVNQVDAVASAIKAGQLDEYHFVTNGTFGGGFPGKIAEVNSELVGLGLTPISIHEHVTTLAVDPTASPRAS